MTDADTSAEAVERRAMVLKVFSMLRAYGEPPRICADAANVGVALVKEVDGTREALNEARADRDRLAAENMDLKRAVIAFAAPWAAQWAKDRGMPDGHLHPDHFDLLKKCGANVEFFTRAAVQNLIGNDYAGGWSNAKRRGWKAVKVTVKPQPLPAPPKDAEA